MLESPIFAQSEADIQKWGSPLLCEDQPALSHSRAPQFLSRGIGAAPGTPHIEQTDGDGTLTSPADARPSHLHLLGVPLAVAALSVCLLCFSEWKW